jgi:hypothetical protein
MAEALMTCPSRTMTSPWTLMSREATSPSLTSKRAGKTGKSMKMRAAPMAVANTAARRPEILLPVVELVSTDYACLLTSYHDIRRESQAKGQQEKGD